MNRAQNSPKSTRDLDKGISYVSLEALEYDLADISSCCMSTSDSPHSLPCFKIHILSKTACALAAMDCLCFGDFQRYLIDLGSTVQVSEGD